MESSQSHTFELLKTIIESYEEEMKVAVNEADQYYLNWPEIAKNGKPYFFASVRVRSKSIAFYFMPIYEYPELLDAISDGLKKKLKGKSCFHFTKPDPTLLAELADLVEQGFLHIEEHGHAI
jgi:hypothetical protein